jgi:branched-chain amino acid transport system permease protein
MTRLEVGFWTALIVSTLALGVIGVVVERLVYRPLKDQPHINSFISAIGALMILENGVMAIWGPQGQRIPNPYPEPLEILGIVMTQQRLLLIGVTVTLILLLQLFIKKTTLGSTIEAVAQDSEGAALVGINVNRVSSLTFAISTAMAATAACMIAPIFIITPSMGALLGMKAFIICILGGLGSIPGAIVGGVILGLMEALGGGYISAAYKDVYAFGALILILAVKPTGLFGRKEA